MKPQKRCNQPGCKCLIDYDIKYCDKHKRETSKTTYQDRKVKDEKYLQFYNSKQWRKKSELYKLKNPICEKCNSKGIVRKADITDHVQELKDRWDLRLDESNLQSLCNSCHNAKTWREKKNRQSPQRL